MGISASSNRVATTVGSENLVVIAMETIHLFLPGAELRERTPNSERASLVWFGTVAGMIPSGCFESARMNPSGIS